MANIEFSPGSLYITNPNGSFEPIGAKIESFEVEEPCKYADDMSYIFCLTRQLHLNVPRNYRKKQSWLCTVFVRQSLDVAQINKWFIWLFMQGNLAFVRRISIELLKFWRKCNKEKK